MSGSVTLLHGDAASYGGLRPDLVFTHPYGPLPPAVLGCPMLLNLALPGTTYEQEARIGRLALWAHVRTYEVWLVSRWAERGWNAVFTVHWPERIVDLTDLRADPRGWFPEELCRRLFRAYADLLPPNALVWDGFMGRGTVGRVARELGYRYVGIDRDPARVALARAYLEEKGTALR